MANKFISCLKGVIDLTGAVEDTSLKNAPLRAWEDNVTFLRALGSQVLAFIRPLQDAMKTEAGQKAYKQLDMAYLMFRQKMSGKSLDAEAMKLIDPRGTFLDVGEKVDDFYRADSEKRVDAFFSGKLKADGLQGVEKRFVVTKAQMVDDLNASDQFTKDPKLKSKRVFTIDDDIKTPLMKKLQVESDIRVLPYDMSPTFSKKMYVRLMKAENPEDVSFSEWFGVTYPQLTKQSIFNPAMEKVAKLVPEMSPAEQKRIAMTMNRIAGRKTPAQDVIDQIVDWAREVSGKPKLEFSESSKFALAMSRNFYRGVMWANPGMALVNLTQSINTAAKFGPLRTLEGARNFLSGEGRDFVRKQEAALFGEFHRFFRGQENLMSKLDDSLVGFGLFNKAEYFNRGLAMHAGISDFMAKNGIEDFAKFMKLGEAAKGTAERELYRKGLMYGINAANETQFLYSVVHQSPLLSGPFSKLFLGQLMSYPINQSEFIWRATKNEPWTFLPRWIAMTGAASLAAYYGAGVVLKGIGGASMLPVAVDLWNEGHEKEAMSVGGWGMINFLPDSFGIGRGLTPMNGAMVDTLRVFGALSRGDEADITKSVASATRSWMTMMPAFLSLRRLSEGYMTQFVNEGKRYEPGSEGAGKVGTALQATGFVPALNSFLEKYYDVGIPGVDLSGRLSHEETSGETLKTSIGLRSREGELRTQELTRLSAERNATISGRAQLADQLVAALNGKDPDAFGQLVDAAIQSGLVMDSKDLKIMISNALKSKEMTKQERLEQRLPRVLKLKELTNEMEGK